MELPSSMTLYSQSSLPCNDYTHVSFFWLSWKTIKTNCKKENYPDELKGQIRYVVYTKSYPNSWFT